MSDEKLITLANAYLLGQFHFFNRISADNLIDSRPMLYCILSLSTLICYFKKQKYEMLTRSSRSSHQSCSVERSVVKNFSKLTGNHLCQRQLCYRYFPVNFANFLRTFLQNSSRWLLLNLIKMQVSIFCLLTLKII